MLPPRPPTSPAQLHALNGERQTVERGLIDAAQHAVEPQLARDLPVLMAAGKGWHAGVVGIVASRLVERHHRPVVVLGVADGIAKGSARSIRGFDLGAAVIAARQQGLLQQGGGHAMAAGMTLAEGGIAAFHRFLVERLAAESGAGVPAPSRCSSTACSASAPPNRPWRCRSCTWRPTAPATPSRASP